MGSEIEPFSFSFPWWQDLSGVVSSCSTNGGQEGTMREQSSLFFNPEPQLRRYEEQVRCPPPGPEDVSYSEF